MMELLPNIKYLDMPPFGTEIGIITSGLMILDLRSLIMKRAGEILMMLCMALSLTACPGGKGGSNGAAATPETTTEVTPATINCQWDWQYRAYVDQNKNRCTPTTEEVNSASYCHNYIYNMQTHQWQDSAGNVVSCVQGYVDFNNFIPYSYINTQGQSQTNCQMYNSYGYNGWFPMQFGSALICVKQTYVNYWYPNYNFSNYYNNYYNPYYNYGGMGYQNYYPTACRYGVDCHTRCGGLSAGGQLGGLWFGGTLGLCL
jgi:hypothetical protein